MPADVVDARDNRYVWLKANAGLFAVALAIIFGAGVWGYVTSPAFATLVTGFGLFVLILGASAAIAASWGVGRHGNCVAGLADRLRGPVRCHRRRATDIGRPVSKARRARFLNPDRRSFSLEEAVVPIHPTASADRHRVPATLSSYVLIFAMASAGPAYALEPKQCLAMSALNAALAADGQRTLVLGDRRAVNDAPDRASGVRVTNYANAVTSNADGSLGYHLEGDLPRARFA